LASTFTILQPVIPAAQQKEFSMTIPNASIRYRRRDVDGLNIFYREAGSPTAPAVLLLHGFPTSSHMFRDLMPCWRRMSMSSHPIFPDSDSRMRPADPALLTPSSIWPT
jgi:hypothetical protein